MHLLCRKNKVFPKKFQKVVQNAKVVTQFDMQIGLVEILHLKLEQARGLQVIAWQKMHN